MSPPGSAIHGAQRRYSTPTRSLRADGRPTHAMGRPETTALPRDIRPYPQRRQDTYSYIRPHPSLGQRFPAEWVASAGATWRGPIDQGLDCTVSGEGVAQSRN